MHLMAVQPPARAATECACVPGDIRRGGPLRGAFDTFAKDSETVGCALESDFRNPLHRAEPSISFPQRSNTPSGHFCQLPSSSSAPNVASDAVEVDLGAQDHRQAGRGADHVQL